MTVMRDEIELIVGSYQPYIFPLTLRVTSKNIKASTEFLGDKVQLFSVRGWPPGDRAFDVREK
jgi:hypothetical protein